MPPWAGKAFPPTSWLAGYTVNAVLAFAAGEAGDPGGSTAGIVEVELSAEAVARRDSLLDGAFGDASWR